MNPRSTTAGFERGGQLANAINRRGLALLACGLALPITALLLQLALRQELPSSPGEQLAPAASSSAAGVFHLLREAAR